MAIDLLKKDSAYGLSQAILSIPTSPIVSRRNPTNNDKAQLGQIWVNRTTGIAYILTAIAANIYTWYAAAAAAASYTAAGTVTAGTGLIATTGTGTASGAGLEVLADGADITGDVTIAGNLETTAGDITSSGSVTATTLISAGTTITAGTGFVATTGGITVAADGADISGTVTINTATADTTDIGNIGATATILGDDVIIGLGDAAGVNKVSIIDSASVEAVSISSDGIATFAGDVVANGFQVLSGGPVLYAGNGDPVDVVAKGSLYIKLDAAGANDRLWIAKDAAGAWDYIAAHS